LKTFAAALKAIWMTRKVVILSNVGNSSAVKFKRKFSIRLADKGIEKKEEKNFQVVDICRIIGKWLQFPSPCIVSSQPQRSG